MPELPDLQVFSHNLNKALKGKKIEKVEVPVHKKLNVSVSELSDTLKGQSVKHITRGGKELYFEFSKGNILSLHLMLHGNLYLFDEKNENKHTILALYFSGGTGLALTDWQSMAKPTIDPEKNEIPDALSKEVDFKFLKEKLQKSAVVKNILMDQKVIRGIGNAYADEILWDAGISPFSVSNKIPDESIRALAKSIAKVLTHAEKEIQKSNPGIITGEVRDFLLIHNSSKTHSPDGAAIHTRIASARKTYYTDEQTLFE